MIPFLWSLLHAYGCVVHLHRSWRQVAPAGKFFKLEECQRSKSRRGLSTSQPIQTLIVAWVDKLTTFPSHLCSWHFSCSDCGLEPSNKKRNRWASIGSVAGIWYVCVCYLHHRFWMSMLCISLYAEDL